MENNQNKVAELVDSIEKGITDLFESDRYREYLKTMSKFYKYSVNNCYLIYSQNPNATLVAGYNKWKNDFKRNVKAGEKGMKIIIPAPYEKEVTRTVKDPSTGKAVLDHNGNPVTRTERIRVPGYKTATVFDISQTEGKELPEIVGDIKGDVENYETFIESLKRISPVPIEMGPGEMKEDGLFNPREQKIVIKSGMSEKRTLAALIHEITHSRLHNYAHPEYAGQDAVSSPKTPSTQEVEAESVAYAVCGYYGIETGENSFGYIALWSRDRTVPELRASLDTISRTAGEIIHGVDIQYSEIMKEKNMTVGKVYPNSFLAVIKDEKSVNSEKRYFVGRFHDEDDGRHVDSILFNGNMEACADTADRLNEKSSIPEAVIIAENTEKWSVKNEELFKCGDDRLLLVSKRSDGMGFDYSFYDSRTLDIINEGVIANPEHYPGGIREFQSAAVNICEKEGYKSDSVTLESDGTADKLRSHNLKSAEERISKSAVDKSLFIDGECLKKAVSNNYPGKNLRVPDPTVTNADLHASGFIGLDMYPLGEIRARDLFKSGIGIYTLGVGTAEIRAESISQLDNWHGALGVKRDEWDKIKDRISPMTDKDISDQINLNFRKMSGRDSYRLFQCDRTSYALTAEDGSPSSSAPVYLAKYSDFISPFDEPKTESQFLESVKNRFSNSLPYGYLGRPLGNGDVLSVRRGRVDKSFVYRDGTFSEFREFDRTYAKYSERNVLSDIRRAQNKIKEMKSADLTKSLMHSSLER